MGLDGISINQLRLGVEVNTANSIPPKKAGGEDSTKIIDGLSAGRKVDADEENSKDHADFDFSNENEEDEDEKKNEEFNIFDIDLSQSDKYELKMDYETNSIAIIEKKSNQTVQIINADKLAVFVKNLSQVKGTLVNRKF